MDVKTRDTMLSIELGSEDRKDLADQLREIAHLVEMGAPVLSAEHSIAYTEEKTPIGYAFAPISQSFFISYVHCKQKLV